MKITNRTDYTLPEIRELVDFVTVRSKLSNLAAIHVIQLRGGPGEGLAWKRGADLDLDVPSLIHVKLGGRPFPYFSQAEGGVVAGSWLTTWQEEFVLILAHECQHVDDFWLRSHLTKKESETAAETHAVQVLKEYLSHCLRCETSSTTCRGLDELESILRGIKNLKIIT